MFYHKLTDQKLTNELMDKPGLQTEGQTKTANSDSATRPTPISRRTTSYCRGSRPLCLTASNRHLGETMNIINQLKFKAGPCKPLRRTSASSWQTGHSIKEATDFEEAPQTDTKAL